jgi:hypothetical protein
MFDARRDEEERMATLYLRDLGQAEDDDGARWVRSADGSWSRAEERPRDTLLRIVPASGTDGAFSAKTGSWRSRRSSDHGQQRLRAV